MNSMALGIYGFGHFGKSLLWMSSGLFFAFYLTEIAGFHPATMALVLTVSLVANAASDWLVGRVLGRFIVTLRAATRWQFAGSAMAGLCFVLFAQTAAISFEIRTAYALATLISFRFGYSLYDVPQNAMLGLVAGGARDRAQIAAVRYAAAGLATILVTLCLSIWIVQIDLARRELIFAAMAMAFALVACGSSYLVRSYFSSDFFSEAVALAAPSPGTASQPAPRPMPVPAILAFGSIVIFSGLMPLFTELKVYYAAFALPSSASTASFLLWSALGQVVAQPVWAWVGRRMALVALYRLTALAVIAAGAFFGLAGAAGISWIMASAFLFGAASSGLLMAIWSIMGHLASFDPHTALARFGLFTSCSKLSQAGSVILIGQVLSVDNYREGVLSTIIAAMTLAVVLTGTLCLALSLYPSKSATKSKPETSCV